MFKFAKIAGVLLVMPGVAFAVSPDAVGMELGAGVAFRGDKALGYAEANIRKMTGVERLDIVGSFGIYRVSVDTTESYYDPYGGSSELRVAYGTRVTPLLAAVEYQLPEKSGVTPFAGLGMGLYLARRDGTLDGVNWSATVGSLLSAGATIQRNERQLRFSIATNMARARFGNQNQNSSVAAESLSAIRLNIGVVFPLSGEFE